MAGRSKRSLVTDPPYQASVLESWAKIRWPGCAVVTTEKETQVTLGPGQRLSAAGMRAFCQVAETHDVMAEAGGECCSDFRVVIKVRWPKEPG
jgi:hypothetical protein